MTITERVMAAGSWDVDLSPDTPPSVLAAINLTTMGFSQLVVTPVYLAPHEQTDATMLAHARYVGLYRRQDGDTRLGGAGLPILMGDEDNKGDVFESVRSTTNGWLSQWVTALTPANHLAVGTVTSPGGAYTGTFYLQTAKDAFAILNDHFGVEWRVNNDFTFDVGTAAVLYGSTPAVVILRNAGAGGRDITLTGVEGSTDMQRDVEDWTAKVVYLTGDSATPTVTTATIASNPYYSPFGLPLTMDRKVEAYNDDGAAPATLAAAHLGRFTGVRQQIALKAGEYDIGHLAPVGSPVYVYDPLSGLTGTTPVNFHGRVIHPATTRVLGYTFPIEAGCGVYLRKKVFGGSTTYTDLTPYVQFEQGTVSVEVGALPRRTS